MGTISVNYGTRTAYPNASNIAGGAAGGAWTVGNVNNTASPAGLSAPAMAFKVDAVVALGASGVTSTGTIGFYAVESADGGTTYTDGLNVSTTANQSSSLRNAKLIYVAMATASGQVVKVSFDYPGPTPPKDHTILVSNGSGAALATSGNSVSYVAVNYGD